MKWRSGRRSSNIEDRRGRRMVAAPRFGKMSGGMLILAVAATLLFGGDLTDVLRIFTSGMGSSGGAYEEVGRAAPLSDMDSEAADFVSVVLGETEVTWERVFAQAGGTYRAPTLVLYSDITQTACGMGQAAAGPFYCPGDQQVYIDLSFVSELQNLGVSGDFAFAYVVAHEVGHHVQNIVGTAESVRAAQARASKADANQLSVRMELQADCYAGVWANHTQRRTQMLEDGDIEEGLRAASAVGDDRLQRVSGRAVYPESFTHGSSEQRMRWFRNGLESGNIESCNTFG